MQIASDVELNLQELSLEKPVVVMVGQRGCPPCEAILPGFVDLYSKYDNVYLGFVDILENKEFVETAEIGEVPVLIKLIDGNEVARSVGYKTKEQIIEFIGVDNG